MTSYRRDRSRFSKPLTVGLGAFAPLTTVAACESIGRHTAKRQRDILAKRAKRAYAKAAGYVDGRVIRPIKGA